MSQQAPTLPTLPQRKKLNTIPRETMLSSRVLNQPDHVLFSLIQRASRVHAKPLAPRSADNVARSALLAQNSPQVDLSVASTDPRYSAHQEDVSIAHAIVAPRAIEPLIYPGIPRHIHDEVAEFVASPMLRATLHYCALTARRYARPPLPPLHAKRRDKPTLTIQRHPMWMVRATPEQPAFDLLEGDNLATTFMSLNCGGDVAELRRIVVQYATGLQSAEVVPWVRNIAKYHRRLPLDTVIRAPSRLCELLDNPAPDEQIMGDMCLIAAICLDAGYIITDVGHNRWMRHNSADSRRFGAVEVMGKSTAMSAEVFMGILKHSIINGAAGVCLNRMFLKYATTVDWFDVFKLSLTFEPVGQPVDALMRRRLGVNEDADEPPLPSYLEFTLGIKRKFRPMLADTLLEYEGSSMLGAVEYMCKLTHCASYAHRRQFFELVRLLCRRASTTEEWVGYCHDIACAVVHRSDSVEIMRRVLSIRSGERSLAHAARCIITALMSRTRSVLRNTHTCTCCHMSSEKMKYNMLHKLLKYSKQGDGTAYLGFDALCWRVLRQHRGTTRVGSAAFVKFAARLIRTFRVGSLTACKVGVIAGNDAARSLIAFVAHMYPSCHDCSFAAHAYVISVLVDGRKNERAMKYMRLVCKRNEAVQLPADDALLFFAEIMQAKIDPGFLVAAFAYLPTTRTVWLATSVIEQVARQSHMYGSMDKSEMAQLHAALAAYVTEE